MKSLILLVFVTACGSEMDKAAAKKIDAYPVESSAATGSDKSASTAESTAITISRDTEVDRTVTPQGCGDFEMVGDFRASINPGKGAVLGLQMNPSCDSASLRYADNSIEVTMCSNGQEWILAKKQLKTHVTEMAIVRKDGMLRFEYHANGKTELLEYISISGELANDAAVCLERLD